MQKKFLQYFMLGYGYMLASAAMGRVNLGMFLPQLSMELAACIYLCYPQCFGGGKKAMRSSSPKSKSPKSRKRSATPKAKKA